MTVTLTARNLDRDTAMTVLTEQREARWDRVVPLNTLRYEGGRLVIAGQGPATLQGDTPETMSWAPGNLTLDPSTGFESQLATALNIPRAFLGRHRTTTGQHLAQLDQTVNYWLGEQDRNVLVRGFTDGEGGGLARALLSDGYGPWEHLDFLVALVQAVASTGLPYSFRSINLTEDTLTVDIESEAVTAMAPQMLAGYVSPFTGERGEDLPVLRSLIRFDNSEVGRGRISTKPGAVVLVCENGMTMERFAKDLIVSRVHRGKRLPLGPIEWNETTRRRQIRAMQEQMTTAVRTFFDPEWFAGKVASIEAEAVRPIAADEAMAAVAKVCEKLAYTKAEQDGILLAFYEGEQLTNGGIVGAITAHAQRVTDPARALRLESTALDALALV